MSAVEVKVLSGLIGTQHVHNLIEMWAAKGVQAADMNKLMAELIQQIVLGRSKLGDGIKYKTVPVGVQEFMCSKFYLGKGNEIYGPVMSELIELNTPGKYDEAVLTGGIGSGKTTLALYTQAYQLYRLSCLRNPHQIFDLDSSSEIKVIFQSLKESLARSVDYDRFRDMIEKSPYFKRHFMFDQDLNKKLVFPNRIEIEPVSGSETASIGQNVIGGVIDEINFMAVVENSKQASDGGTYDQAIELYNTIARRRKSRFMKAGALPGMLCLVSSKKTPGQFTDRKEEEAKHNPRIFVYDKRVWDIKPNSFGKERFRVFVGDEGRKPRVLADNEVLAEKDQDLIDHIPLEFRQEFEDDITKALRDIAGRSTQAIHPFLPDTEKVVQNFGKHPSILEQTMVDFVTVRPVLHPTLIRHKECPRFAHLDLALTGDSAGLVIGHMPGFRTIEVSPGVKERLPICDIDLSLEIDAPKGGEIEFENIRRLLYRLRELGLPIKWVTLDSFQSADTMQILRSKGFIVGYQSMDTTMVPYTVLKSALYQGRVPMHTHPKLRTELATLERNFKKNKIDHPAHGSKDISDALAGVVYGLTMRKELWISHGVPPNESPSVYQHLIAEEEAANRQGDKTTSSTKVK